MFWLFDRDHERERTCVVTVELPSLAVTLAWSLEVNEAYLHAGEPGPLPFDLDETVWFDDLASLTAFVRNTLTDLRQACYLLHDREGRELDELPEDELDFTARTTTRALPGNIAAHKATIETLETAYGAQLPPPIISFLARSGHELDHKTALDLPDDRIGSAFLGVDAPVLLDVRAVSLVSHASRFRRPGLCAWAKFVGQGLGLRYFGVVQASEDGRIFITTSAPEQRFLVAPCVEAFAELVKTPNKLAWIDDGAATRVVR